MKSLLLFLYILSYVNNKNKTGKEMQIERQNKIEMEKKPVRSIFVIPQITKLTPQKNVQDKKEIKKKRL